MDDDRSTGWEITAPPALFYRASTGRRPKSILPIEELRGAEWRRGIQGFLIILTAADAQVLCHPLDENIPLSTNQIIRCFVAAAQRARECGFSNTARRKNATVPFVTPPRRSSSAAMFTGPDEPSRGSLVNLSWPYLRDEPSWERRCDDDRSNVQCQTRDSVSRKAKGFHA
ncbi:hypothetical protein B7494_g5898 [Chlorociboria aeruginascens]|nr:hypothetical protein B7494_g5898 [Chlorociboria aeruginascens]